VRNRPPQTADGDSCPKTGKKTEGTGFKKPSGETAVTTALNRGRDAPRRACPPAFYDRRRDRQGTVRSGRKIRKRGTARNGFGTERA